MNERNQPLNLPDADVVLYPGFFAPEESDALFLQLREGIAWKQETVRMFGKAVPQPRLTAWHGDEGARYTYSGLTVHPEPWTEPLLLIKARVKPVAGTTFNSVLLNLYRSERDSVSWHADDEPELGPNPVIASVSFGAARRFGLRHKEQRDLRHSLDLTHGSLLLMRRATQHHWQHQIPKSAKPCAERINLTFRTVR
jgi:alkylated DNA repair dioxygenase AlkB